MNFTTLQADDLAESTYDDWAFVTIDLSSGYMTMDWESCQPDTLANSVEWSEMSVELLPGYLNMDWASLQYENLAETTTDGWAEMTIDRVGVFFRKLLRVGTRQANE